MPVSENLMFALLSMDAYNRGYNPGIADLGSLNSFLGTAKLINESDTEEDSDGVNAGFYALAYDWNGQTVISYRGSDNIISWSNLVPWSDTPGSDLWNGYGVGGGSPAGEQARLAAEFFQSVTGTSTSDPQSATNTILTGHSLGGGLAGPH